ncbi:MAG: exosortase K [Prevotella sp.]|jgi:exosortase K|nr:exosortase K [Prevotella sp.]
MKTNIILFLICLTIFTALKLAFPYLETDALRFLLAPTNKIIEFIFGSTATYNSETGYFHPYLNMVINKSCSGLNFYLISFLMYSYLIIKLGLTKKWLSIPSALVLAYITTILANVSRIAGYVIIMNTESSLFSLSEMSWLHQAEGIFVYLAFLILAYITFNYITNKIERTHEKATQS